MYFLVKKNIKFYELTQRFEVPYLELEKLNKQLAYFKKLDYLYMENLSGPVVSVYSICKKGKNFFQYHIYVNGVMLLKRLEEEYFMTKLLKD